MKKGRALKDPPTDHEGLLKLVTTYAAFIWAMFTQNSPLYKALSQMEVILRMRLCTDNASRFTPLFCKQVVWAIICDMKQFVTTPVSAETFDANSSVEMPRSYLVSINENLMFQTDIARPHFPAQWRIEPAHQQHYNQQWE